MCIERISVIDFNGDMELRRWTVKKFLVNRAGRRFG